jgi:predicted RNA-binding protein YlqC (UPF0109 family)/cold shock CspA family protein
MEMKELIERIVRALVDSPGEVEVSEINGINVKLLQIKVSKPDVAYLIGKKGKNINALREIVSAAGKGKRCIVELLGEGSSKPRRICSGRIKSLFEDRNYGFIEADHGRAVYFHGSSLKGGEMGSLSPGQQVEFEIEDSPKGLRAVNLVRLSGRDS